MGVVEKPVIRVLNKIDLLSDDDAEYIQYEAALSDIPFTVATSSTIGTGMQDFVAVVEEALQSLLIPIEVTIPYSKGDLINEIHQKGHVDVIDYRTKGTYIEAKVPKYIANKCETYNENNDDVQQEEEEIINDMKEEEEEEEIIDWVALGRGRHSATGGKPKNDLLSSSSQ